MAFLTSSPPIARPIWATWPAAFTAPVTSSGPGGAAGLAGGGLVAQRVVPIPGAPSRTARGRGYVRPAPAAGRWGRPRRADRRRRRRPPRPGSARTCAARRPCGGPRWRAASRRPWAWRLGAASPSGRGRRRRGRRGGFGAVAFRCRPGRLGFGLAAAFGLAAGFAAAAVAVAGAFGAGVADSAAAAAAAAVARRLGRGSGARGRRPTRGDAGGTLRGKAPHHARCFALGLRRLLLGLLGHRLRVYDQPSRSASPAPIDDQIGTS